MDLITGQPMEILEFLLPGFVAAAVLYSLTSHPKPGAFERVVQALIFTIVVQAVVAVVFLVLHAPGEGGPWIGDGEVLVSVPTAVVLGLMAVHASNKDYLHRLLRRLGITRETSYPSEWYSAFSRHSDCYVVLHLKGERRLYGWPTEWPGLPDEGHFLIEEGEWLRDGGGGESTLLEGIAAVLVPVSEVEMVEFVPSARSE